MEAKERLQQAFNFLKSKGVVHTQKEMAALMRTTEANMSAALNGVPSVLTTRFFRRFNQAADNIFNIDWLLYGTGEMLVEPSIPSSMVAMPTDLLEKLYAELHALRTEVANLNSRIDTLEASSAAPDSYRAALTLAAES